MANLSRVKKQSSAPEKTQAPDYIVAIIDSAKDQRDTVNAAVNDLVRICGAGDPYLTQKLLDALCNVSSFIMPSKKNRLDEAQSKRDDLGVEIENGNHGVQRQYEDAQDREADEAIGYYHFKLLADKALADWKEEFGTDYVPPRKKQDAAPTRNRTSRLAAIAGGK